MGLEKEKIERRVSDAEKKNIKEIKMIKMKQIYIPDS